MPRFAPFVRRHGRSPIAIVLVALGTVALLVGAFLVGSSLERSSYSEPRGEMSEEFVKLPTVEYQGKTYAKKLNMTTLLVMGIDKQDQDASTVGYRSGGQADFMLLLLMDHDEGIVRQLQIDRDTMAQVAVLGVLGKPVGTKELQICLSHAFGGTAQECGEHAVQAVQNLLQGVSIDGFVSLDIASIDVLNASLGGVQVTIEEDLTALDEQMRQGETLLLTDHQAELFVRSRISVGDGTNASRMKRQSAYLSAAVDTLLSRCKEDVTFTESFLEDMQRCGMVSNLSKGRLVNEANRAQKYAVQPIESLEGEHRLGADGFMEFHVDEQALIDWVIHALYREKK